jgi:hypothetical protein
MGVSAWTKRLSFWVYGMVLELAVYLAVLGIIVGSLTAALFVWIVMALINIVGWYFVWRVREGDLRESGWRW